MADDFLTKYFANRPPRTPANENRPADKLMQILNKVEAPSRLRHMPPDPTATRHPDGDKPTPRPTRRKYPKPSM